jgi:hypothetical protein
MHQAPEAVRKCVRSLIGLIYCVASFLQSFLGLGLTGAYFVGRAMQSILLGVSAIDFSVFGALGLLLFAALLASYLPASRARPWKHCRQLCKGFDTGHLSAK